MKKKSLIPKIAIICSDAKKSYFPTKEAYETEKFALRDAKKIAEYAQTLGKKIVVFPANRLLAKKLQTFHPDIAINVVDSIEGIDHKAANIPALLELLNIPYTGCNSQSIGLGYNKYLIKQLLHEVGIPVPTGQLFVKDTAPLKKSLRFPLISKLNNIHGSVGLIDDSISMDEKHLRNRIKNLLKEYPDSGILVEEYIEGEEISVFVVQDGTMDRVYMSHDIFTNSKSPYTIASYEFRWVEKNPGIKVLPYSSKTLENLALRAFYAGEMSGYGKFDIRKDKTGTYYFIDANPNPAFGPPETDSPLSRTAEQFYNTPFSTLLGMIIRSGLSAKR